MERIFNYLKSYFVQQNVCIYDQNQNYNLIVGAKYLIVYCCDNNTTEIHVGYIFQRSSNINYNDFTCYDFTYHNSKNVTSFNNSHINCFQLVNDFNLSHCSDIIQTFYSFTDINPYVYDSYNSHNGSYIYDCYIHVIKTNNNIIITDSFIISKYKHYLIINHSIYPHFYFDYKLTIIDKLHDIHKIKC